MPRDILDERVPHQEQGQELPRMFTPGPELQTEPLPQSAHEQNTFRIDPAVLPAAGPPRIRRSGMRAVLVIGIIAILVLCCLACSALLAGLDNLSDPFRDFIPR